MRKLISKILITLLIVTSIFPYSYADEITQSTQDITSQGISKEQEQKDASSTNQSTNNNKDTSDNKDITKVDKQNTDSNTDVDNTQNINNTDNQNTNSNQNTKNNIINNNQNNQNNDNPNEMTYEGTGFKVIFTLTGQWSGGHNTNIKIINTGDKAIENWHIKFTTDDKITRFWNAKIQSKENNSYLLKNERWNKNIPQNGMVEIGYEGEGDFTGFPTSYELLSAKMTDVAKDDYTFDYKIISDWTQGFNAEITLTNNSDKEINDWEVEFDMDNDIKDIWNATIQEKKGTKYILKSPDFAQNLAAKSSFTFGFTVMGGNSSNAPTNINLKKMIIGSENQNEDKDKDKDKIEIKIDKDNFAKIEGYEPNFISDNITKITGSLKGKENISKLSYKIISATGNTMSTGDMDIQEKWTIKDFKFSFGENTLTVTATDKQDKTYKDEIKVYSIRMGNIRDILQDNAESQYMLTNDTDEDGIPDFMEMQLFLTDPFKKDSDENGIDDGYEDADEDGLTNLQEIAISLNPVLKDTDGDGLTDGDELNKYSTNPFDPDSDKDGATDKWELDNGYDPKVAETSFDIVKKVEVDDKIKEVKIELKEVSGKTAESLSISEGNNGLVNEEVPGYISTSHDFEAEGDIKTAKVTYTLDSKLFENKDFSPALYYFNEKEQRLDLVKDQKLQGNILTANLTHFSKYILIDKTIFDKVWEYTFLTPEENDKYQGVNVAILIDTSEILEHHDPYNGMRKYKTLDIIDKMTDKDMATVISFSDNPTVLQSFTSDKTKLKQSLDNIYNIGGKNLDKSVEMAIEQFKTLDKSRKDLPKYIILLSNGLGCFLDDYTDLVKKENIPIYTIPVGMEVLEIALIEIANATGGVYCNEENIKSLYNIFQATEKADLYKDSDGDGIKDYYEKEMDKGHLRLGTGIPLIGTDYLNKDSDGDGLLDGEEVKVVVKNQKNKTNYSAFRTIVPSKLAIESSSNPVKKDSDGDGLCDYYRDKNPVGKTFLPRDPHPNDKEKPLGIWKKERYEISRVNYGTTLNDDYELKYSFSKFYSYKNDIKYIINENKEIWDLLWGLINSKLAEDAGSVILKFKKDNNNMAEHSQVETWQKKFGYIDFYDLGLEIGTSKNTRRKKFKFFPKNDSEHIVWMWRGYYLNLGAGAEIGIYNNPISIETIPKVFLTKEEYADIKNWESNIKERLVQLFPDSVVASEFELVFWDVVPFELPMTLSLYDYKGENTIDTVFLWKPKEKQWWITGFNGDINNPVAERLVVIGSIDFSERPDLYYALKRDTLNDDKHRKYMFFDDDDNIKNKNKKDKEKKAWIVWWGADRSS